MAAVSVKRSIGFPNTYLLDIDYPVDSAIQHLNNRDQVLTKICLPGNKTPILRLSHPTGCTEPACFHSHL